MISKIFSLERCTHPHSPSDSSFAFASSPQAYELLPSAMEFSDKNRVLTSSKFILWIGAEIDPAVINTVYVTPEA